MLNIIYGNSGSGKTQKIYDLIKDDAQKGKLSYLIVPEQETVNCEETMLNILPYSAQLTVNVLNFSRLANLVFRSYGGLSYNYADNGVKTLIMWKNLKELSPFLKEYSSQANKGCNTSFAKEMLNAINEFKAYCVTVPKLEKAQNEIEGQSLLKNKLSDLSLIMASYTNNLSENYSDTYDDLSKLAELLKNHDFFKDANVYIDSFTSFTGQEYAVLEQIIRGAENTYISLTLDTISSVQIHYESTADTAMRLRLLSDKLSCELKEEHLGESKNRSLALKTISNSLWNPEINDVEVGKDDLEKIKITETDDPYQECYAVTNTVRKLMTEGFRCKDIAIIARDASVYKGVIDVALEKAKIPYFFSQSTDIMSKAPVKFIMSALKIKLYNWRCEDVIEYLKTDLCGFDKEYIDVFECYASLWNLRGSMFTDDDFSMNPNGYSDYVSEKSKEDLRKINDLKNAFVPPLLKFFTILDTCKTAKDMCIAVYNFLQSNNISQIIEENAQKDYAKGKRKEAAELLQLYNAELKALENIANALGDEEITLKEFVDSLKIMLKETSINTIPTAKDQVVIGSASMLRTGNVKCTIILGINEGEFPQTVKETGVFSDNDKKILGSVGISLSGNSFMKSSEELFYAYRAVSSPSEKLFLFYHDTDFEGSKSSKSMVIERIKAIFSNLQIKKYTDFDFDDTIMSKNLVYDKIGNIKDKKIQKAVTMYFENFPYENISYSACESKKTTNRYCKLSEDSVNSIFNGNIYLSQSKMDQYVKCPFSYMFRNIIKANENVKARFDDRNIGNYVHYILENYLRDAKNEGYVGKDPDKNYISDKVNYYDNLFKNEKLKGVCENNERLNFILSEIKTIAMLTATSVTREFAQSKFTPEFFELNIGKSKNNDFSLPPILITRDNGMNIKITGIADRVDVLRENDDVYIRVADYKTGEKSFSMKEIEKGRDLQLPLYLFSFCSESQRAFRQALNNPKGKIIPAGAMYVLANPSIKDLNNFDDEDIYDDIENSVKSSGFLLKDENIIRSMSPEFNKNYICGVKNDSKKGLVGNALMSSEEMDRLKNLLNEKINEIANGIADGKMNAQPCIDNCQYCNFKVICRTYKKGKQKF